MQVLKNFINGQNIGSGDQTVRIIAELNPSSNKPIYSFAETNVDGVEAAIQAARNAFQEWRKVSRVNRADLFDNLAQLIKGKVDFLAELVSTETGKSLNEAKAEIIETLHMIQYVAGTGRQPCGQLIASELATKEAYVMRKPKGVVAVISPWNFPAAIGSAWTSAPAIVEGNCVVHKPSELTSAIACEIAQLYQQAGFPPGVYNLVLGAENTGRALVESEGVDCILFTGSAGVGRYIRKHCAGSWKKSCSCEQGGKSAVIVFRDANYNLALEACLASAFKLSGQRCVSSGRLLIQRDIMEHFADEFVIAAKNIMVCDPFMTGGYQGFTYGPLISKEQVKRVEYFNQLVRNDPEAQVLFDPDGNEGRLANPGNFLRPFVYKSEWRNVEYLKEEVFGPHVALIPFDTVEDAIRIYNDTEYGLSLGVITDDFRNQREIRDNCNSGMIYINGSSIGAESHLPFSGVGKSGYGYPSAAGTYKAVTHEVAVTINYGEKLLFAQGLR